MLSDNIKNLRKKNNISQDEFAELLGVSRQSVSLWETGQTQPTIDNIIALAKYFNVSSDVLLGTSEPDVTTPNIPDDGKKNKIAALIIMAVALILIVGMVIFFIFGMPGNSGADEPLPDDNSQVSDVVDEPDRKTDDATLSTDVSEPSNSSSTETPSGTSSSKPSSSSSSSSGSSSTSKPSSSSSSSSSSAKPTTSSKPSSSTQKTETEKFDLFTYCRDFAIDIGTLNGDYCIYQQSAAKYGGSSKEYFSISFWNDSNMVEFCLHCPIDDTQSINFYLRMRGGYNGKYEYLSSNYYRSDGTSFMDATGYIDPAVFSEKYPISCDSYFGSTDNQTNFMEITRVGMCDLIKCLKKFVEVEKMDCGFFAFGFSNF